MTCILRASDEATAKKLELAGVSVVSLSEGGWNAEVSNAEMSDRKSQITDTIRFLTKHRDILGDLAENSCLDFAVASRDVAAQVETFPTELLRLAAQFKLDLVVSIYAIGTEEAT